MIVIRPRSGLELRQRSHQTTHIIMVRRAASVGSTEYGIITAGVRARDAFFLTRVRLLGLRTMKRHMEMDTSVGMYYDGAKRSDFIIAHRSGLYRVTIFGSSPGFAINAQGAA